jgi:hypothetical protein
MKTKMTAIGVYANATPKRIACQVVTILSILRGEVD